MRKLLVLPVAILIFISSLWITDVRADSGYGIYIEDDADLLSDSEEAALYYHMEPITAYGNVAFKSISANSSSTASYAKNYYYSMFGSDSGTVFLIDMDNREIYIYSNGAIYKRITKSYANTITDNVYTYASKGDYLTCASKAFDQIATLLDGGRIAQPMKYITNALIAIILAFIINFIIIKVYSRRTKTKNKDILLNIFSKCEIDNANEVFTHHTKVYGPPSSSGGSRGGGGGGSGGGGGHSV